MKKLILVFSLASASCATTPLSRQAAAANAIARIGSSEAVARAIVDQCADMVRRERAEACANGCTTERAIQITLASSAKCDAVVASIELARSAHARWRDAILACAARQDDDCDPGASFGEEASNAVRAFRCATRSVGHPEWDIFGREQIVCP